MKNNRGLSDLVSNVLIILLVFASIAIMGVIILNLVKISGQSIENTAACKQINVKPVDCIHNLTDANLLFATEYESGVVIDEVDTVALFSDGTSANQTVLGAVLGNFETQSIRESNGDNNYDKFYTVTKFKDTKGIDRTCVSDSISCKLYNPSGASATDGDPDNGEVYSNGGTSLVKPSKSGGGSGPSGSTGPTGTGTDGACGTTKYSCSVGTVNSTTGYNKSDFIWACSGINGGNSASCNRPINSNNVFNLTETCNIYTVSNYAGCSSVDINGTAYCWNYDVLSGPWSSVAAGINLSTSYVNIHNVSNELYLNGHWLQQAPSNQNPDGPLTPGVAYQGAFSLNCLLGNSNPNSVVTLTGSPSNFTGTFGLYQMFDFSWNDNADDDVITTIKPIYCAGNGQGECEIACGITTGKHYNVTSTSQETTGKGVRGASYISFDTEFAYCNDYSNLVSFEITSYNVAGLHSRSSYVNITNLYREGCLRTTTPCSACGANCGLCPQSVQLGSCSRINGQCVEDDIGNCDNQIEPNSCNARSPICTWL